MKTGLQIKFAAALLVLSAVPSVVCAQEKAVTATKSYLNNGVFLALTAMIIILAITIFGLTEMVKAGASMRVHRDKKEKNGNDINKTLGLFLLFMLSGLALQAQAVPAGTETAVAPEPPFDYWGLGASLFYSMMMIIVFEMIIIIVLYRTSIRLIRTEQQIKDAENSNVLSSMMESKLIRSITESQAPEEEHAIVTDHEYDGIRELDNNLPGWWKYGFYVTIIVGIIYLFHFHILKTGPNSAQEYDNEVKLGEEQVAAYKKTAANSVDESNVVLLTDATSLSAGKTIYGANCTQCHGMNGEGKIGPNLTDAYWIHKGGVVDVFKSVKYGWTDKGMKSWQQDLRPLEMQQVVSYILSLQGTNPADAKEKEGDLYVPEGATPPADTMMKDSAVVSDSVPAGDTAKKK